MLLHRSFLASFLAALVTSGLMITPAKAAPIEWVRVANPGNAVACVATCIEGIRNTRAKTGRSPAAGVFRTTGTPRKHGEFTCFRFFCAVLSRPRPAADWGESLQ